MRRTNGVAALLLAATLTACGGGGDAPKKAGPSPTTTTPSPTPTLPTVAADEAAVKAALVTPKELGTPWVEPKSVNKVKQQAKGQLCPGKASAPARNKPRAQAVRQMTEGSKTGAGILSVNVYAYAYGTEDAWRQAIGEAATDCTSWKALEGNYVTLEVMTAPPSVTGADAVLGHYERIWADAKHTQLQYVRQILEARVGRIALFTEYAFLVPKNDPQGKDLTKSVGFMTKQVAKVKAAFPQ